MAISQTKPQQHIRMSFPNIPIPLVLRPINRGLDSFLTHNRFFPQTAALRMENRSNFFS